VVLVGSIHAPAEVELFEGIQRKELTIVGAWQPRAPLEPAAYYQWSQYRNREVFMELMRRGVVRVDHLVSHRARGAEIPQLYEEMATAPGDWLGVLFDWTE
jgi:threonine dehydrogenase-like Zn-dependent dehydrogenase